MMKGRRKEMRSEVKRRSEAATAMMTPLLELCLSDDGSGSRSGDDDENEERVSRLGGAVAHPRLYAQTRPYASRASVPSAPSLDGLRAPIIAATELLASEGAKMAVTAMQ